MALSGHAPGTGFRLVAGPGTDESLLGSEVGRAESEANGVIEREER